MLSDTDRTKSDDHILVSNPIAVVDDDLVAEPGLSKMELMKRRALEKKAEVKKKRREARCGAFKQHIFKAHPKSLQ